MITAEILRNKMFDPNERIRQIEKQQVLVLSTGYEPLFRTNWKRAMSAISSGRAEVVEEHESLWIGTISGKIPFPLVVRFVTGFIAARLRTIEKAHRPSKKMLWKRDKGKCQYCSTKVTLTNATVDHVIPRSRGGKESWKNLVIACSKCNCTKGNNLVDECGMSLLMKPTLPKLSVCYID